MKTNSTLHKTIIGLTLGLTLITLLGAGLRLASVHPAAPTGTTQVADGSETHGSRPPTKPA